MSPSGVYPRTDEHRAHLKDAATGRAYEHWRPTAAQRHYLDALEQYLAARTSARRAMARAEMASHLEAMVGDIGSDRLVRDLFPLAAEHLNRRSNQ